MFRSRAVRRLISIWPSLAPTSLPSLSNPRCCCRRWPSALCCCRSCGGPPRLQLATRRRRRKPNGHQSRVALRHPPGLAPALERGPQAAIESEAVDRRRGGDRVDAQQHHAVPLEAALFQDTARGRVRHPCARFEPLEAEILEGVVDQGARRLGGIAVAPIRYAQPVADLGRFAWLHPHAADSDQRIVRKRDRKCDLGLALLEITEEAFGVRERVGMRDSCRVLGDAAVVGERRNGGRVFAPWCAQMQPCGCQYGGRENRGAWPPLYERHCGLLSCNACPLHAS